MANEFKHSTLKAKASLFVQFANIFITILSCFFKLSSSMKKFNLKIFFIATFIIILLNFFSWTGLQQNDFLNGSNSFWRIIAGFWQVLRFPLFTLCWHFLFGLNNFFVYSTAVFLNCAFYGFLIERIFSLLSKKSKLLPIHTSSES